MKVAIIAIIYKPMQQIKRTDAELIFIALITSIAQHMHIGKTLAIVAAVAIGLAAVVPALTETVYAAMSRN
jgi:hypothetical protein